MFKCFSLNNNVSFPAFTPRISQKESFHQERAASHKKCDWEERKSSETVVGLDLMLSRGSLSLSFKHLLISLTYCKLQYHCITQLNFLERI